MTQARLTLARNFPWDPDSVLCRYGLAALVCALAIGLRAGLTPWIGPQFPFATLFFAVLVSAWYGGYGPALFSIVICSFAALFLFLPDHTLFITSTDDQVGMVLFILVGLSISWLGGRMRALHKTSLQLVAQAAAQGEQLRMTLHCIGDGIIVTDAAGRVTSMNPVAEQLTEWRSSEAQGLPLEQVLVLRTEDLQQPVESPVAKVLRDGKVVGLANHTVLVSKQGTIRPIDDSASPIRDQAQQLIGAVMVFRDITERRAAERAVREGNARKLAMFESALDAVVTMDHTGTILEFNPAAERIFGYSRTTAVGQRMADLIIPAGSHAVHQASLERFLQTGEARILGRQVEVFALRADGTQFPAELAVTQIAGFHPPLFTGFVRDVTAKKRAEALVVQQREQLRVTLSSIGDAVIATDAAGRVNFMNRVAEQLTGWSQTDADGQPLEEVFQIINESTRQHVDNPALRALREGVIVGLANHTLLLSRGGQEWPIDDSAAPIRSAEGEIIGAVLVFRDISDRKRTEQELAVRVRSLALSADAGLALIQSGELSEALPRCTAALVKHLDGALARIWTYNPRNDVLTLQATSGLETDPAEWQTRVRLGETIIGTIAKRRQSLITTLDDPLFTPAEQAWAASVGLVAFAGHPLIVDERLVGVLAMFSKHQPTEPTLNSLAVVSNKVALGIDRKRAEAQLSLAHQREAQRSQRLHQVAQASLAVNSAANLTNVVSVIRSEAQRIVGTQRSEVYLGTEDRPSPAGSLAAPLVGHAGRYLGQICLTEKANGEFNADDQVILNQLAHISAVALENARLHEELRDRDRRKDEFLAMLAHELRNPLAPIRNALELFTPDADRETLTWIKALLQRQVQHIVRLVDDLLDVSRVMRGRIQLKMEPLELRALLQHTVDEAKPLFVEQNQAFEVMLPDEPVWVRADPVRLSQIVSNLLNNASKYTERDGRVWLKVAESEGEVTISVRDTGIGISPDMLTRIFDPFSQVEESLDRSRGGLGIGLALVRSLVNMHQGSVRVTSAGLGQGSEFVIRLPVTTPSLEQTPRAEWVPVPVPQRKILVVDDNYGAAVTLSRLLTKFWGHDVELALDGVDALAKVESFQPSLVLMDIGLPGLDGYEVAKRIRALPNGDAVFLAAVTGYGQDEDRRRSAAAGFNQHLVKPISVMSLQELFLSNLNGRDLPN